jgi:3',5'-cyclic AMP phosphodiesterase CpdA
VLRAAGPGTAVSAVRSLLNGARLSTRGPYVQGVTATSAIICWVSKAPGAGAVRYGKVPDLGREDMDRRISRRHAVALVDLDPGSTYIYRIEDVDGSSQTGSFRTALAGEDSGFSFAVVGDSGSGGKGQLAVARLLGRLAPDLILHTGDVVYPAGEERHYDRRFFAPYGKLIKDVPIFPVLGNHDVRRGNGAAFLANFHPPLGSPDSTKRYYSFDWGNAHFVALDSELYHGDKGSSSREQKAFLERDLAATRKRWKVVFLHRSPYGSSRHGGDDLVRYDLEPVFTRHGVDLVFAGHDHVYERTVPTRGVTYVVSGGGGRRLYPAGKGRLTACSKSAHHAVLVRVDGDNLSLEATEPDGTVFDRFYLLRKPEGVPTERRVRIEGPDNLEAAVIEGRR